MDINNPIILTQISVHDTTPPNEPNEKPVSIPANPPLSQATENNDVPSLGPVQTGKKNHKT